MRLELICILVIFGIQLVSANPISVDPKQADKTPITFEDVIPSKISLRGFNGTWISGNQVLYRDSNGNINIKIPESTTHERLVEATQLSSWTGASFVLSPTWNKILIRHSVRSIFRHSVVARYAVLDITTGDQIHVNIADGNELNICVWVPHSDKLAFVRNNNVYIREEDGTERQLTTDGVTGVIYNGVPDWVYEEEVLGSGAAMWFSPDGNKMAIIRFNDTEVEEFRYYLYGEPGEIDDQYPTEVKLRYPKSGTTNPTITLKVIDISNSNGEWQDIDPPSELENEDHILGAVTWSTNNELVSYWMNRRQNEGYVQKCLFDSLTCENVISLSEPDGWLINNTPNCTKDGRYCFMITQNQGWFRAIKIDMVDKTFEAVTPLEITVQSIYGFNEDLGHLYYLATPNSNPEQRHVYQDNNCLSCGPTVLSYYGDPCRYASASFSSDLSKYALVCSGPSPSFTVFVETETSYIWTRWEDNIVARDLAYSYDLPKIHFIPVDLEGGFKGLVRLRVPSELDIEAETHEKKYPMIVNVYGGPNTARAVDGFSFAFMDYMVAGKKVIEVTIDGRGSSFKGTDLVFSVNNKLGTVEVEDQIIVAKHLQEKYKFFDPERSGIWGWSYGGFATATALSKDTDRVFQCGISVAPVTSWIYYDTIYTERFMGTPQDNEAGYNASDISRHLDQFKYHDFLLIHGNADDNVHYQQAMALSKALQHDNIMFDQMNYPDEAHSLSGVSRHLYHTMEQFWTQCLSIDDEQL